MKKETLLTTAVLALLLLNFGILGFLFFRRPPHPAGERPAALDRHIIEKLHLNAEQQQKFEQLKSAHREQMQVFDRAHREALGNYFALLKNDTVLPAQQDSLLAVLSQIQKNRATVTFQHFMDLKALCSQEQKKDFDDLVPELMQVILPQGGRPSPGPGRN